jgi:ElaB/YqjD/DUF883 family membrane-anchored ribosome-binding protein
MADKESKVSELAESAKEKLASCREKTSEFAEVAKEKYAAAKQRTAEALGRGGEVVKERVKVVDDKVHNNPWPVVGGVFVCGILLGFILGKKAD